MGRKKNPEDYSDLYSIKLKRVTDEYGYGYADYEVRVMGPVVLLPEAGRLAWLLAFLREVGFRQYYEKRLTYTTVSASGEDKKGNILSADHRGDKLYVVATHVHGFVGQQTFTHRLGQGANPVIVAEHMAPDLMRYFAQRGG